MASNRTSDAAPVKIKRAGLRLCQCVRTSVRVCVCVARIMFKVLLVR